MLTYKNPKAKSCVVCERVFVPERDGEEVCGSVCGLEKARARRTFTVCDTCGNKRCLHATDHRHECTNSNAPGQAGSVYA